MRAMEKILITRCDAPRGLFVLFFELRTTFDNSSVAVPHDVTFPWHLKFGEILKDSTSCVRVASNLVRVEGAHERCDSFSR